MSTIQPDYAVELRRITDRTATMLMRLPADVAARRPAPGKWSIKEIVGHLIDSAANNHQRFVRAQWTTDLVMPGYDQDAWVTLQRYQDAPWPELVILWSEYNLHLARVFVAMPAATRERLRHPHNLDERAFRPVSVKEPVTLDYFMRDYVEHLKHHVAQITALAAASAS